MSSNLCHLTEVLPKLTSNSGILEMFKLTKAVLMTADACLDNLFNFTDLLYASCDEGLLHDQPYEHCQQVNCSPFFISEYIVTL